MDGKDTRYMAVFDWLDRLGGRIIAPDENADISREVCFVDAKIVSADNGAQPPDAEHYVAVPMVGQAGAGSGIVPADEIASWILVYRNHRSVARRTNLLAVEIGRGQDSMEPTLHPQDIILVDRDDWGQIEGHQPPGNIFLVREPGQEGGAMVKRVAVEGRGDTALITFYSDNPRHGPRTWLMADYDHDLRAAIVGRVVWAWTDISRK